MIIRSTRTAELRLALDRAGRYYDVDGRLHVPLSKISKADVNEYLGSEIPDSEALGLSPRKVYRLYRDPKELAAAAATFNNLQLLMDHVPVTPGEPMKEITVGSMGTDAAFSDPWLTNSLVVWDQEGIDAVESEKKCALSCAYRYVADMTPGTHKGLTYDGVMRSIAGNHVALVETGRAGPDVVVGDSKLETAPMKIKSRKALMVQGALAAYLGPRLAADAKLDLTATLSGVTAKSFPKAKAKIVAGVTKLTTGKLAADADLEGLVELMDALERVEDEPEAVDEIPDEMPAVDDEGGDVKAFLKDKLSEDDFNSACAMMEKGAADADPDDKEDKDAPSKKDDEPKDKKDDKPAMDAAAVSKIVTASVSAAVAAERQRGERLAEARELVAPIVGALACDSADEMLRLALDEAGVDHAEVKDYASLKALVTLASRKSAPEPVIAQDRASGSDWLTKNFPDAKRIVA